MNDNLNFKIIGAGPSGILLAIALSGLEMNIFLKDLLTRDQLICKDKTYAITHSTRKILEKFNIWSKLKPYLFGFDTLSLSDSVTSVSTLLSVYDLDKDLSSAKYIGWVVKHSDLMKVFFNEIDKKGNIFFSSSQDSTLEPSYFDYKFISTGSNSFNKRLLKFINFQKIYNHSCLTFKVLIRGNIKGCAYEIFREEGPLALLPLGDNLYQIIWTSSTSKSIDRLHSDKNFLLDNLSTILQDKFQLDQIVGDVNVFPVSLSLNIPSLNLTKSILVGDSFHTFHPVGGQGLNTCWRDVNAIFDILKGTRFSKNPNLQILKYKYYSKRFLDISATILVTDFLITFFANRNFFLLPLRKFSFFILNKLPFVRFIILNHMTKSINYSSIK